MNKTKLKKSIKLKKAASKSKACEEIELKMALTLQLLHEEKSFTKKENYVNILSGIITKYKEALTGKTDNYMDC